MKRGKGFDWAEARTRLARMRESPEQSPIASEQVKQRIFRERAKALARPLVEHQEATGEQILVLRLGATRYGIPLANVVEVLTDSKIAPAPGAPPEVRGLIQVRGEVRAVWNLRRLLGLAEANDEQSRTVLLLKQPTREWGVEIDEAEDIRAAGRDGREANRHGPAHTLWTTADLITVLDVESLFRKVMEGY
jgi:chemotaxis signal transduction protein